MKKFNLIKVLVWVLVVAIASLLVIKVQFFGSPRNVDVQEGRKYIKTLEKLDVEDLEGNIKSKKSDEKTVAKETGTGDVFSQFDDYVIYGDSRTLHFVTYGYLEASRVFAENGYSFQDVRDWDPRLRSINPSTIYLAYGSNDINREIYTGETESYKQIVRESIAHIQEICPDAQLYVLGMIPPNALGQSQLTQFRMYKSLNAIYQDLCKEIDNCTYIDDEVLGEDGMADIYVPDGFHFTKEFYPTWAKYIIEHTK